MNETVTGMEELRDRVPHSCESRMQKVLGK